MHIFTSTLSIATVISFLTTTTNALPQPQGWNFFNPPSSQQQSSPTLPTSTLPAPSTQLKFIALGLGTQNYTCASSSAIPVAIGAHATLYDATELVTTISHSPLASSANSLPCLADHTSTSLGMPAVGLHYFNSQGIPNFDLSSVGLYLEATKVGVYPAPTNACTGRNGNAAVPWLFLQKDSSGLSQGLSSVYRVDTSGGSLTSCESLVDGQVNQVVTTDYAALYWFYS